MSSPSGHPRCMSLFLHQIWRNASLNCLLINGSSAVNGCHQSKTNMWVDFDVRDNRQWMLSQLLWTHMLARSNGLKTKTSCLWICFLKTSIFRLLKTLIDGLEWCLLLWCFYQLFRLLFWRHPFTTEHPLLRQRCKATFLQIWWRNKRTYISDGLRVRTFSANFHFFCELFLSM